MLIFSCCFNTAIQSNMLLSTLHNNTRHDGSVHKGGNLLNVYLGTWFYKAHTLQVRYMPTRYIC